MDKKTEEFAKSLEQEMTRLAAFDLEKLAQKLENKKEKKEYGK